MVKPGRLFVGNLSQNVRQKELEDAFSKWGEVATVDKKYDFAFVVWK